MVEIAWASAFLILFVAASAGGLWLQRRLAAHHKSQDTIESVRMIVAAVVTFSALVLGLLVTSVKSDFDDHTDLYRDYGISLIQLDQQLSEYGAPAARIRQLLRSYTAAVFVLAWPEEPRPGGSYPTNLHRTSSGSDEIREMSDLLSRIDVEIETLQPSDPFHERLQANLTEDVHKLEGERWLVIERRSSRLSPIFIGVLVSWLVIVFFIFGVVSPRNRLVAVTLGLSALSIASCLYLILDLDTSLGGFISVSSQPFRDALWHMDPATAPGAE